jgi:hypothetical protein
MIVKLDQEQHINIYFLGWNSLVARQHVKLEQEGEDVIGVTPDQVVCVVKAIGGQVRGCGGWSRGHHRLLTHAHRRVHSD